MINLYVPKSVLRYPEDIELIKQILRKHDYNATDEAIAYAWSAYSTIDYAAQWLSVDNKSDQEILEAILEYLEKES